MSRRSLIPYIKKALVVLALLALLFLIRSLVVSIFSTHDRAQIFNQLEQELSQKKKEQAYLSQKLYYAKTDVFVEEEARAKLGLVREGEHVVVDQKIESVKPKVTPQETPNYQKWFSLFF